MKTTKPISTISYNSVPYLTKKLNDLLHAHKLAFWAFVPHKPEDDECGKKHHSHVYAEPSVSVQTEDIRLEFAEFDPSHPDKPLGCLPFMKSKFSEWYLYSIHDAAYLASKEQSRVFHYSMDDVVTSDSDNLLFLVRSIDRFSLSPYSSMKDAIDHGITWSEWFSRGLAPINQVAQFERAWKFLQETRTSRNGRPNHDQDDLERDQLEFDMLKNGDLDVVDTHTGEIITTYRNEPKNG